MIPLLLIALTTCLAALAVTPLAARLALARGIVDQPGTRKIHSKSTPYLGGLAVFTALLAGLAVAFFAAEDPIWLTTHLDLRLQAIIGGAVLLFAIGLYDDVRHMRASAKLCLQVLAATIVYACGVRIGSISLSESFVIEFGVFGAPITIFWIVGVTNALNLIDGMDGLASGIGAVASAAIGILAFQTGNLPAAALMAGLFGALVGFLRYNLNPARIFLGDAGSMLIGFLLATTSVYTASKSATVIGIGLPLIALGVPILDTLFSMLRRFLEGRSVFSADRNHLHHRMLDWGLHPTKVVAIVCAETAAGVALSLFLFQGNATQRLAVIALGLTFHILLFRWVGAVRLRDSVRGFRELVQTARQANDERVELDDHELMMGEAETIEAWWKSLTQVAPKLAIARLGLEVNANGEPAESLTWAEPEAQAEVETTDFVIQIPQRASGQNLRLQVSMSEVGSIESAGKRMAKLGRLLDKNCPSKLPETERKTDPRIESGVQPTPISSAG